MADVSLGSSFEHTGDRLSNRALKQTFASVPSTAGQGPHRVRPQLIVKTLGF